MVLSGVHPTAESGLGSSNATAGKLMTPLGAKLVAVMTCSWSLASSKIGPCHVVDGVRLGVWSRGLVAADSPSTTLKVHRYDSR